jgi:glycosyltransferase involved in cell wall biosynthesis
MAKTDKTAIRVTFVLPSFAGGGAERVILTLARHLDRARFSPDFIVLDGQGALANTVPDDITVTDLECPRLRQAWPRLSRALKERRGNVVVPTISHINLAVLMLRRQLGPTGRVIARESNTPSASLGATNWPRLYRWLYRRYIPRADTVLCPSRKVASEFTEEYGIATNRLATLPHPVDVALVRHHSKEAIREAGAGLRFVAAGRMTRQKGFDRLIDLLPELPSDTHVTFLGEGGDLEGLRQRGKGLGVENHTAFPGFVANPWRYYAGADAFLLPSRWEGMPNAALEALAVGAPVIAFAEAGGIVEINAPKSAVTIANDGKSFAEAMRGIANRSRISPRPSLLPSRFALDGVMAEFEALLIHTVAGTTGH